MAKKVFRRKVQFDTSKPQSVSHRAVCGSALFRWCCLMLFCLQQVDTNIVAVQLATLANGAAIHTGDYVLCSQCHAVLSAVSVVTDGVWACEFCNHSNGM